MLSMSDVPCGVDPECREDWMELSARIGQKWPAGTMDILNNKNPELSQRMKQIEGVLSSLMIIRDKPKEIRRRWKLALDDYERAANCAIAYARRHLGDL